MNRFEEEQFVHVYDLIFQGYELIIAGMQGKALEQYRKVEDAYHKLPDTLKQKIQVYAVNLYKQINNARIDEDNASFLDNNDLKRFRFKDGSVVCSLIHLVYVTEKLSQSTWQCHVNSTKNEILDWIKFSLNEEKLADLLDGITDMKSVRDIIFRHILMSSDKVFNLDIGYCYI
jgi:hypothetical protein